MTTTLYLECFSGISGDMTVAALLDLGADEQTLLQGLKSLPVDGYEIKISRKIKNGHSACDFDVILDAELHDESSVALTLGQRKNRNLFDIVQIIEASDIAPRAKVLAKRIFHIVARAEAVAHQLPLESVYFHELGATDSIVDIVSVAICLDNLNIENVICSDLHDGTGFITYRYGQLPVPVPAVVEIASAFALPLHKTEIQGEMITPTGAAIVAGIRNIFKIPEHYVVLRTGLGAGKRNYPTAGILKAMLIEAAV